MTTEQHRTWSNSFKVLTPGQDVPSHLNEVYGENFEIAFVFSDESFIIYNDGEFSTVSGFDEFFTKNFN